MDEQRHAEFDYGKEKEKKWGAIGTSQQPGTRIVVKGRRGGVKKVGSLGGVVGSEPLNSWVVRAKRNNPTARNPKKPWEVLRSFIQQCRRRPETQ